MLAGWFLLLIVPLRLCGQNPALPPAPPLTLNPSVDSSRADDRRLISLLTRFLTTRDADPTANPAWDPNDFRTYRYPYADLHGLERGAGGIRRYPPTLLELVRPDSAGRALMKVAFAGPDGAGGAHVRAIYTFLAEEGAPGQMRLRRPLMYNTRAWPVRQVGSIRYIVSPGRRFSWRQATEQRKFCAALARFFAVPPVAITYYSCTDPVEMFRIRGFDYLPNMYYARTGGQNEAWAGTLFSGSNAEAYPHEVTHSYTYAVFGDALPPLLNEGLATYLGGSDARPYAALRAALARYVGAHPTFRFADYLEPYRAGSTKENLQLPYLIGALLCERAYQADGRGGLLAFCRAAGTTTNVWATLALTGLTPENIEPEMRVALARPAVKNAGPLAKSGEGAGVWVAGN